MEQKWKGHNKIYAVASQCETNNVYMWNYMADFREKRSIKLNSALKSPCSSSRALSIFAPVS